MTAFHIFLVVIGLVIVAVSYIISEKITNHKKVTEEIKENDLEPVQLTELDRDNIEKQIGSMVYEASETAVNTTDDKLSQISNEKIMAVNEFSNQILEKIDQNHSEVVFLYNMLNEKEVSLKETVREIDKTKVELEKAVRHYKLNKAREEREKMHNSRNRDVTEEKEKKELVKKPNIEKKQTEHKMDSKQLLNQANIPAHIQDSDNVEKLGKNNEQILQLYKEGKTVIEIAKILELGQGEVKLVIDLFQGAKR